MQLMHSAHYCISHLQLPAEFYLHPNNNPLLICIVNERFLIITFAIVHLEISEFPTIFFGDLRFTHLLLCLAPCQLHSCLDCRSAARYLTVHLKTSCEICCNARVGTAVNTAFYSSTLISH